MRVVLDTNVVMSAVFFGGLQGRILAKLMGVQQPRISDLVRGRIEFFSIDTLVDMLTRLVVFVSIVTKPKRGGHRVA